MTAYRNQDEISYLRTTLVGTFIAASGAAALALASLIIGVCVHFGVMISVRYAESIDEASWVFLGVCLVGCCRLSVVSSTRRGKYLLGWMALAVTIFALESAFVFVNPAVIN